VSAVLEHAAIRNFKKTAEASSSAKLRSGNLFVVERDIASDLTYDLRLEVAGVLKSWSISNAPSVNPCVKRVARERRETPLCESRSEHAVVTWDSGTYEVECSDVSQGLDRGELRLTLKGKKLQGRWLLVRTARNHWLLAKDRVKSAVKSSRGGVQSTRNSKNGGVDAPANAFLSNVRSRLRRKSAIRSKVSLL